VNRNKKIYAILSTLLLAGAVVWGVLGSSSLVEGSEVTVSATVATSVSCTTDVGSTAFGALLSSAISTSTPNASSTMSCNYGLGCTLSISDANAGLATTSPAYTIGSVTGTLQAGVEGYGIIATTTATGSGGTLGIASIYLQNFYGNLVGNLNTTSTVLASSTASISNREIVVKHKTAVSNTTQAASYTDTITYSCAGNT